MAASTSLAEFRSGFFSSAISSTWARVTVPTLFRLGSPDPLASLQAARLKQHRGGGGLGDERRRSLSL